MKITLSSDRLLDDILADSALNAIFNKNVTLLTANWRPALQRIAVNGATMVAAEMRGELSDFSVDDDSGEMTFELSDTEMHPDAVKFHIATAVSFATLHLVAISVGDGRRASSYKACLDNSITTFREIISAPPRLMFRQRSYC